MTNMWDIQNRISNILDNNIFGNTILHTKWELFSNGKQSSMWFFMYDLSYQITVFLANGNVNMENRNQKLGQNERERERESINDDDEDYDHGYRSDNDDDDDDDDVWKWNVDVSRMLMHGKKISLLTFEWSDNADISHLSNTIKNEIENLNQNIKDLDMFLRKLFPKTPKSGFLYEAPGQAIFYIGKKLHLDQPKCGVMINVNEKKVYVVHKNMIKTGEQESTDNNPTIIIPYDDFNSEEFRKKLELALKPKNALSAMIGRAFFGTRSQLEAEVNHTMRLFSE